MSNTFEDTGAEYYVKTGKILLKKPSNVRKS